MCYAPKQLRQTCLVAVSPSPMTRGYVGYAVNATLVLRVDTRVANGQGFPVIPANEADGLTESGGEITAAAAAAKAAGVQAVFNFPSATPAASSPMPVASTPALQPSPSLALEAARAPTSAAATPGATSTSASPGSPQPAATSNGTSVSGPGPRRLLGRFGRGGGGGGGGSGAVGGGAKLRPRPWRALMQSQPEARRDMIVWLGYLTSYK
mgnify:CR=1 FL=1